MLRVPYNCQGSYSRIPLHSVILSEAKNHSIGYRALESNVPNPNPFDPD